MEVTVEWLIWSIANKVFCNILQFTDEEIEQSYEEFYEDVHTEFLKFGELVNFKVIFSSFPTGTTWLSLWQHLFICCKNSTLSLTLQG